MGRRRARIAVVGAGLSGLTAARALLTDDHEVIVLEKARGAGGRVSTRRTGNLWFDHGAQFFTVQDPRFREQVEDWQSRGVVRAWEGRIGSIRTDGGIAPINGERFVGVPGMSTLCRDIAERLPDVRFGRTVEALARHRGRWSLKVDSGDDLAVDALVITAPPAQARALLKSAACGIEIPMVEMRPCWAVMALFDRPLLSGWDALAVPSGPLGWVASQRSRPGRPPAHAWVLHASAEWSECHLEADRAHVETALIDAARQLPGAEPFVLESAGAHRWRYALARHPSSKGPLPFPAHQLVVTGDWRQGGDVEGAFLGGLAAAAALSSW